MEIRRNGKVLITGKKICLIFAIISALCAIYWLIQCVVYDKQCTPPFLMSAIIGLYLVIFSRKK